MNITTGTIHQSIEPLKENESEIYIFDLESNDVDLEVHNDILKVIARGKKETSKESIINDIIEAKTPSDVDNIFDDIIFNQKKLRIIFDEYNRRVAAKMKRGI